MLTLYAMCRARTYRCSHGFTLVELMIVITIISILAALTTPMVAHYITNTNDTAAQANLVAAEKAIAIYYGNNGTYPPALTPDLFLHNEPLRMPAGWTLQYDSATGNVTLVAVP